MGAFLEVLGSNIFRGLVLLGLAVAWWFALDDVLLAAGVDPKIVLLITGFTRVPGAIVLAIWGAWLLVSAMKE